MLHFFFTSYYQLLLLYWITAPFSYASNPSFTIFDAILSVFWGVFFVFFHGLYSEACYGLWILSFRNVALRYRVIGSRHFVET
jgi:hypothetical protein